MLLELAPEWSIELDRGPDWIFIRLRPPRSENAAEFPIAEKIYRRLEQAFCYRLVLELNEVSYLRSWLVGELVRLHKRIAAHNGTLRLCGLSAASEETLKACRLFDHFPAFENRHDAVMGHRPKQPR
jgi:anti-anti-sigma factor